MNIYSGLKWIKTVNDTKEDFFILLRNACVRIYSHKGSLCYVERASLFLFFASTIGLRKDLLFIMLKDYLISKDK